MFCLATRFRVSLPPIGEAPSRRAIDKRLAPSVSATLPFRAARRVGDINYSTFNPPNAPWSRAFSVQPIFGTGQGTFFSLENSTSPTRKTIAESWYSVSYHSRATIQGALESSLKEDHWKTMPQSWRIETSPFRCRGPAIMSVDVRRLPWAINNEIVIQTVSTKDP